jgi:hypothetical protein
MRTHLNILILLLTFSSCSNETDIRKLSAKGIEFTEMPIEVQAAIQDYYRPTKEINSNGDTSTLYGLKDELICLDSAISQCEFKAVWSKIVSSWLDHLELIVDDKIIIIEQGVLVSNRPYVIYDGLLYCRKNMNARNLSDPSKDEFKVLKINKN